MFRSGYVEKMDIDHRIFNDLTTEDLVNGYTWSKEEKGYACIFCGEVFEKGVIYTRGDKMIMAEKAAELHVDDMHGGAFNGLLQMDKQVNGISQGQRKLMTLLYEKLDNRAICECMDITPSTVRAHKFNLQKLKRQAKIFLALMQIIENTEINENKAKIQVKHYHDTKNKQQENNENADKISYKEHAKKLFSLNSLHPFFTQYRLK